MLNKLLGKEKIKKTVIVDNKESKIVKSNSNIKQNKNTKNNITITKEKNIKSISEINLFYNQLLDPNYIWKSNTIYYLIYFTLNIFNFTSS